MEAVKIVSQLEDKTDSVNLFGGFNHAVVHRGVWKTFEDTGLCMIVNGITEVPDRVIFKNSGTSPKDGDPCKLVLLEMSNHFQHIGTDARVFFLGTRGQTIEAIY